MGRCLLDGDVQASQRPALDRREGGALGRAFTGRSFEPQSEGGLTGGVRAQFNSLPSRLDLALCPLAIQFAFATREAR